MSNVDYDLVVIGGGGAGLSAAVTAAEAGCTVMVIEAESKVGGSTGHSEGVFNAAATSVHRALGINDSIDAYFDYYMTLNAWRQPAALVRAFCENATPTTRSCSIPPVRKFAVTSVWVIARAVVVSRVVPRGPDGMKVSGAWPPGQARAGAGVMPVARRASSTTTRSTGRASRR